MACNCLMQKVIPISYKKKFSWAKNPTRRLDGSIGFDLYPPNDICLEPQQQLVVDTGIIFEMPQTIAGFIYDKSSVAFHNNVHVMGGVIDPTYRGTIGVILKSLDNEEDNHFTRDDAIAQIVFHYIPNVELTCKEKINMDTPRGTRGFGGTTWNE